MRVNYTSKTEVVDLNYLIDNFDPDSLPDINILGICRSESNSTEYHAALINLFKVIESRLPNRDRIESLNPSDFEDRATLEPNELDLFAFSHSSDAYNSNNFLVDEEYLYKVLPMSIKVVGEKFQGIQGERSTLQGIRGPIGNSGSKTGVMGETGIQGLQGLQGTTFYSQGPIGYQGYRGTSGPTGNRGIQGIIRPISSTRLGFTRYSDKVLKLVVDKFKTFTGIEILLNRTITNNDSIPAVNTNSIGFRIDANLTCTSIYSDNGFYQLT